MKNFIFFLLLVGVLGCEKKNRQTRPNSGSTQTSANNGKAVIDSSNIKFNRVVNRIEYEMIKILLKNGINSEKNAIKKQGIEADSEAFVKSLPLNKDSSWDGNKVFDSFTKIKSKYPETTTYITPLSSLKANAIRDMKSDTAKINQYLIYPSSVEDDDKLTDESTGKVLNETIIKFIKENPTDSKTYQKNMTDFIKEVYKNTHTSPAKEPTDDDPSEKPKDSSSDFPFQFIGFLLLVATLLGIWQYLENKKLKSEQDKTTKKLNEQLDEITKLKTENQKLENEIFNLKQKQTNDPYHSTGGNLEQVSDNNNTGLLSTKLQAVTINNRSEPNPIKYAGRPNEDGSFTEIMDTFISGKSLYCIDIEGEKAEFWIDDEPITFAHLTRFPDNLLRPVCEELNTQTANHLHLSMQESGQARWDEDKKVWKVTQKAKIKYS
ncbi:MAG: hypothetical protein MUF58_06890 [Arcicella sp.]|jgi:hypothetical protein|nr:hypothetical protein [Arcicella sp.]